MDEQKRISGKSNGVIVGEIVNTLRAQGNPDGANDYISSSSDSPVVSGKYYIVPSISIGIMDYEDFLSSIGDQKDPGSTGELNAWNSVGAVGLDAIFAPYTTMAESGRNGNYLPHFTNPESGTTVNSITLNPFNIFNGLSGNNTQGNSTSTDPWFNSGHNISFATNYNPYDSGVDGLGGFVGSTGTYPGGTGAPVSFFFEEDHFARKTVEVTGIRGVGLKSPIIISGPGYDINGRPVPGDGSGNPHAQAAWNTSLWKSGPLDARWDESRGVWRSPTVPRIRFTILSTSFSIGLGSIGCDSVVGLVNHVSCGGAGVNVGEEVNIYDPEYCYFNLPISLLVGLNGTATLMENSSYMSGMDSVADCLEGIRSSGCIWMIDTLCCAEEETLYE